VGFLKTNLLLNAARPDSGRWPLIDSCAPVMATLSKDAHMTHSNMESILRPANAEDASSIAACVNAAYEHYVERIGKPPKPMLEDYRRIIAEYQVSVVDLKGEVVGVIVLKVVNAEVFVGNVAVLPSHQGLGIGRTLLAFAENEARRQGFSSIHLYTHEKMVENQAIYSKIGYIEYDRRLEDGYARVYMRKMLA
jgi:ribosomal protein S18 acetylase RimI-like enzyme